MTTSPRSGNSGMCLRTSSSKDSSPDASSIAIAKAVNCFEVEPRFDGVAVVNGAACSRLAAP